MLAHVQLDTHTIWSSAFNQPPMHACVALKESGLALPAPSHDLLDPGQGLPGTPWQHDARTQALLWLAPADLHTGRPAEHLACHAGECSSSTPGSMTAGSLLPILRQQHQQQATDVLLEPRRAVHSCRGASSGCSGLRFRSGSRVWTSGRRPQSRKDGSCQVSKAPRLQCRSRPSMTPYGAGRSADR